MATTPSSAQLIARLAIASLLAASGACRAQANQAESNAVGTVVFITGQAQLERSNKIQALGKGQSVQPGDRIQTGANGHVHLRMIDQGLIAVRASSRLQIQDYAYHPESPADNKVRINLERGVARTVSGKAGEAARERYRFNTPVAAIGLRGTDYVVQAMQDVTRVTVLRGEVTVSPFGAGCAADALAPCAGALMRELNARTPHAYLEVRSTGDAPRIVPPSDSKDAPNRVSPSRPEEPSALIDNPLTTTHASTIMEQAGDASAPSTDKPESRTEIAWGRWQSLSQLNTPTLVSLLTNDREIIYANELFGLLRPAGGISLPDSGQITMSYASGEAYIPVSGTYTPVALSNGKLTLDFNTRQFDTSLRGTTSQFTTVLLASGQITAQGLLNSNPAKSNMNVAGTLSSGANEAGYLFDANLANGQRLIGATRWVR